MTRIRLICCFTAVILLIPIVSHAEDERIKLKLDPNKIFSLLTGIRLDMTQKKEETGKELVTAIGPSASRQREKGRDLPEPSARAKQAKIKALKVRRVVAIQN